MISCVRHGNLEWARSADGIVIIDPVKAKGQKDLLKSCPYRVIFWNEQAQIPQKCTLCAHLLDRGWKEPRCVEACPTGALLFGDLDDPRSEIARLVRSGKTEALHPEYGAAMVPLGDIYTKRKEYVNAFTVLENAMSVIFHHRVAIRRRHFIVSAVIPYIYILCLGFGLLLVTLVTVVYLGWGAVPQSKESILAGLPPALPAVRMRAGGHGGVADSAGGRRPGLFTIARRSG